MAQGSVLSDSVVEPSKTVLSTLPAPTSTPKIASSDLNAILDEMQKQLQSLKERHSVIRKRIAMVRHTIDGLVTVFGRSAIGEDLLDMLTDNTRKGCAPSLTRTCSQLLAESSRALTVSELLAVMQERHPTLWARNNNPKASLTTVLNRLSKYGAVQSVSNERGARAWRSTIELEDSQPLQLGTEIQATNTMQPDQGKQQVVVESRTPVTPELRRACRIAILESREAASPDEIYARIVRRASFSFEGIERPLVAIAGAIESLAEEARNQNPEERG